MRWANKYMWYVFNCRFRFSIIHTLRQHRAAKQKSLLIWCNRAVLVHLMLDFSSAMKSWHQLKIIIIMIAVVVVVAHLNIQRLIEFPSVNAYSFSCDVFFLSVLFFIAFWCVFMEIFSPTNCRLMLSTESIVPECLVASPEHATRYRTPYSSSNSSIQQQYNRECERTFWNENAPKP